MTQPLPDQLAAADQPADAQDGAKKRAAIPRVRIILGLVLFIIFILLISHSLLEELYLGIVTIIGMGSLFDPVIAYLDKLEPHFNVSWPFGGLKGWITRHLPTPHPLLKRIGGILAWPIVGVIRLIRGISRLALRHPNISVILILFITLIYQSNATAINDFTDGVVNTGMCSHVKLSICSSGIGVSTLSNGVHIGLIKDTSSGTFDTSNLNGQEQQVEKDIFDLDTTACSEPHLTLAVVTMLSRTVDDPIDSATIGLNNLRGAFLAQNDYNASKPATKICLVIANLGTSATTEQNCAGCYAVPRIMEQLTEFARHDETFQGIVGFPYSQQAYNALHMRQSLLATLPIVSASATSDDISNIANFYRIVSSDKRQSAAMAQYFCGNQQTTGVIDIFDDGGNAYIHSLSSDFTQNLQCIKTVTHESYNNGLASSIQSAVDVAVKEKKATLIIFPGYSSDLITLEEELEVDLQSQASSVTILGGDGLYDSAAISFNTFASVYFSTYGSPLLSTSAFIKEYKAKKFPFPFLTPYKTEYTFLTEDSVLAYDATNVFAHALERMSSSSFPRDSFSNAVATVAFQGLSGYISLNGLATNSHDISDPLNKTVYIMCVDQQHILHWVATYGNNNQAELQAGQNSCG